MIPQNVLSTQSIPAQFVFPRNIPKRPLIDYEYGGTDLNDAAAGLRVKVWKGEFVDGQVILSAQDVSPVAILSIAGEVLDIGIAFDQNMQPFVCWELVTGGSFFYWFDSLISNFVTTQLPAGSFTPRCCIDDTRDLQVQIGNTDIILAYCRAENLYFRMQRERYQTEHLLGDVAGPGGLIQIGLNRLLRMQFQLSTSSV